jgi:hypothetical protein
VRDAPRSAYDDVGDLIAALIARFDLQGSRSLIMRTYKDICRDSLAFPCGTRPPGDSRINHDGTPIQFAVTVGSGHHTLQFLGEATTPGMVGLERMRAGRECITAVAGHLHVDGALSSVTHLLDALAPETAIDLLADPGGAYWVGAAFAGECESHLRIYVNANWGKEDTRWARLSRFAAHFEFAQWPEVAARLEPDLQPLGIAITLSGEHPPTGRIYLSAYGKRMPFYEELADVYGGANLARQVGEFGRCVLGDDYAYPTRTAVCSFGLGGDTMPDFKFELCAHCLFASDVEATARLRCWFAAANLDASDYLDMLDVLSSGPVSGKAPDLHCYVGVGLRRGAPYATIYLKPRLIAP